jgi:flagellar biosynthesis/type III secretory pathway protein FliH
MGTTVKVRGDETLEEVYFLVRLGTWHQSHLGAYLELQKDEAYQSGIDDATQDGYNAGDVDDAFSRGYEQGHNEGYKDGYNDGNRESSYDNYR